jgi:hypothetical protein
MFDLSAQPSYPSSPGSEPGPASEQAPELVIGPDSCLWLCTSEAAHAVRPVRCFPWSGPDRFISLRAEDGTELYLVRDPSELEPTSRAALTRALAPASFVLEIVAVESIEEDYEVRVWRTRTHSGRRTFQTALDSWPWAAPAGGHFIQDIGGDLFHLPPLEALDEASRQRLFAYVG